MNFPNIYLHNLISHSNNWKQNFIKPFSVGICWFLNCVIFTALLVWFFRCLPLSFMTHKRWNWNYLKHLLPLYLYSTCHMYKNAINVFITAKLNQHYRIQLELIAVDNSNQILTYRVYLKGYSACNVNFE